MEILKKTIAFTLAAVGLVVIWDGSHAGWDGSQTGLGPCAALLNCWVGELLTPQMPYSKFETLSANKEIAQRTIERVDWVDTNYAGKYLEVKLKNEPKEYHVRKPKNCKEDPFDRLNSY